MNYLTLDLDNGDLVLSDNSVWKSLNTWLDGGTLYSDYYDASNCGDFWVASTHWISIDSESTYLTFTIEYEFIDATATDSCLCQIKFDGFEDGGVAVTADSSGLNISTDASKHINCDYSNANIKIDITVNLLTKEITTYIHKDNEPLAKKVNVSNYSFTEFVIQAGSRGDNVYKLPTTTKLLNVSVSDVAVSYSNFPETINYIDKLGLARIWANIKSYISSQLLGKSDTGHTHVSSDVTDLLSDTHTWTSQQSYNSDLNLNYASTDVDDIVNSVAGSATLDNFVHMTGNETVSGIKSFPDGVIANVTGSSGSCTGNAATATEFSSNQDITLTGDVTGTASSKAGWSVSTTLANSGVTAGTYGPAANVTGDNNATISVPQITVDAKGRVTSVTNRTLTCKNNTYTVNNATLTIQQNGTNVATFTSNASANATANITVPTKTSDLTNDSHQTITTTADTTSAESPAHSGTFTCIDSVTRDSYGHVTTVNTKTITLPADNNTDTKVTQTVPTDTVEWHNSHYRGINLISDGHFASMAALLTAIRNQDWSDIYIGDYVEMTFTYEWTTRTVKFYVGEIDKFYNVGNFALTTHHLVMVTGDLGVSQVMNDSNTTAGGYVGSKAHTVTLPALYAILNPLFNNAILTHKEYLSNTVLSAQTVSLSLDDGNGAVTYSCNNFPVYSSGDPSTPGCVTAGNWYDCNLVLMSEIEMFGSNRFSSSGIDDMMCPEGQIAAFKYNRNLQTLNRTVNTWLRNVNSASRFCGCFNGGTSDCGAASIYWVQLRPRFLIG